MEEKKYEDKCKKKDISNEELKKVTGGSDPFNETGVDSHEYDEDIKKKA